MPATTTPHTWNGRLWPALGASIGIMLFLIGMFPVIEWLEPPPRPTPVGNWLLLVLIIVVPLGGIFGSAIAVMPRRLSVSPEGLYLQTWLFGTHTIPRTEIAGVRPRGERRGRFHSIEVEVRTRPRPLNIADVDTLGAHPEEVLNIMRSLFGRPLLEVQLRAAATSEEAVRLSLEPCRWQAASPPRSLLVLDVVCPILAVLAAIIWLRIWSFMIEGSLIQSRLLIFAMALIGGYLLLMLSSLLAGGSPRELQIDDAGITLLRRFRTIRIPTHKILGARLVCCLDTQPWPRSHASRTEVGYRGPWGTSWAEFPEDRFEGPGPGFLAGVLLHRLGELLTTNLRRNATPGKPHP